MDMSKYWRLACISLATIVISVSLFARSVHGTPTFPQNMGLQRSNVWLGNATEGSWFVWSSELYYVYTDRPFNGSSLQMKIIKFSDKSVVSTFGSGYGYQDVVVDNGTLYVFAVASSSQSIVKFTSTDLTTWSSATTIKTLSAGNTVYNISATKNSTEVVLAYEYLPSGGSFTIGFIKSSDYSTWSDTGTALSGGYLCPELLYVNSNYYMLVGSHISSVGQWHTWMAKSSGLSTWSWSRLTVLRPVFEFEDINTTDADVIEFDGKVYVMYMVGDQNTYMRLTYATFDGTLSQFVEAFQQPN